QHVFHGHVVFYSSQARINIIVGPSPCRAIVNIKHLIDLDSYAFTSLYFYSQDCTGSPENRINDDCCNISNYIECLIQNQPYNITINKNSKLQHYLTYYAQCKDSLHHLNDFDERKCKFVSRIKTLERNKLKDDHPTFIFYFFNYFQNIDHPINCMIMFIINIYGSISKLMKCAEYSRLYEISMQRDFSSVETIVFVNHFNYYNIVSLFIHKS
ncbi:hypothetical protein AGLY_006887, partial [Aphis glycines]